MDDRRRRRPHQDDDEPSEHEMLRDMHSRRIEAWMVNAEYAAMRQREEPHTHETFRRFQEVIFGGLNVGALVMLSALHDSLRRND